MRSRNARGARRAGVKGLAGEQLRTITLGSVAAIVGEVTARPRPTVANLLRYDRILTELWARNDALLLPCDSARYWPTRGARSCCDAAWSHAAQTPGGCQGSRTNDRAGSHPIPEPPTRASSARPFRRRVHRAAGAARDVPQLAKLRPAIRRWIRDERMQMRGSIATVYHLVPRGAADRYRSALERAAREAGIRLRVLGPRLPYAFSDE